MQSNIKNLILLNALTEISIYLHLIYIYTHNLCHFQIYKIYHKGKEIVKLYKSMVKYLILNHYITNWWQLSAWQNIYQYDSFPRPEFLLSSGRFQNHESYWHRETETENERGRDRDREKDRYRESEREKTLTLPDYFLFLSYDQYFSSTLL